MSVTFFNTNSSSVVKLWSERTLVDFISDTEFIGQTIKAGVLQRFDETSRSAGDTVTASWLQRLTGAGLVGSSTATGYEESLDYFTDQIKIDLLRKPVSIPSPFTIDQQRVLYNLNEDAYRTSVEWMQQHAALGLFNQLAGNTTTTFAWDGTNYSGNNLLQVTGLNSVVAPSTGSATRIFRPNGDSTDQAVGADTTATSTWKDIQACEVIANTSFPLIRPLNRTDQVKWHYYVHPQCFNDMVNDTTSPNQFRDYQVAKITSGRGEGEIMRSFVFSETRVFNTRYIPQGVNSGTSASVANTRRNVFTGRNAAGICFGRGYQEGNEVTPGLNIRSVVAQAANENLVNSVELLPARQGTILSEAFLGRNVQRLSRKGVQASAWKRQTAHVAEDIVCSA